MFRNLALPCLAISLLCLLLCYIALLHSSANFRYQPRQIVASRWMTFRKARSTTVNDVKVPRRMTDGNFKVENGSRAPRRSTFESESFVDQKHRQVAAEIRHSSKVNTDSLQAASAPLKLERHSSRDHLSHRGHSSSRERRPWINEYSWSDCGRYQCRLRFLNGSTAINVEMRNSHKVPEALTDDRSIPYCSDILFDRLKTLDETLTALRIPYYISFGTLLGSLQQQDIFGWTSDVDIVLSERYLRLLAHDEKIHEQLRNAGFLAFVGGMRLVRLCFFDDVSKSLSKKPSVISSSALPMPARQMEYFSTYDYIDSYMEFPAAQSPTVYFQDTPLSHQKQDETNNEVTPGKSLPWRINPSDCAFDRRDVYPLSKCRIRDHWFPCPRKQHKVMRMHYGNSYLVSKDSLSDHEMNHLGC